MDPGAALLALAALASPPARSGPWMRERTGHLAVGLHTTAGGAYTLVGPRARLYGGGPEILLGLAPAARVELFARAGAGPAYVVGRGSGIDLVVSGTLGARFSWQGVPVRALARAEAAVRHGAALMLELRVSLGR
jgi:hypothetical protein